MINLTEVAWAGPVLVSCVIAYLHKYGYGSDRDIRGQVASPVLVVVSVASGASVAGMILVAALDNSSTTIPVWFVAGWGPFIAFVIVPYLAQSVWFASMAARSRTKGTPQAYNAWRAYLLGNLAAPVAGLGLLIVTVSDFDLALSVAWWSASIGWSVTLVSAFAIHTAATDTFLRRDRGRRTMDISPARSTPASTSAA